MMHKLIALPVVLFMTVAGYCQDEAPAKSNNQYFGIQSNQLLRQLLNFGNNSGGINNPYLITYAVNSKTTGVGFSTGLGYNYNQFNDGDAITPRENTSRTLAWRFGIDKKSFWGKHWVASIGGDILMEGDKSISKTTFNNGTPQVSDVEITTNRLGLGPRFTISYSILDRLLIGTEGSYYFKASNEVTKATALPRHETKLKSFTLVTPAVIYLIFKF